ncbi:MAG: hypothetical protein WBB28_06525 [Crinalium sp.]
MSLTPHSLWIKMPSFDEAKDLVSSQVNAIAASARKLEKFDARISYPGCKQPLRVLASMVSNNDIDLPNGLNFDLLGADYIRIHEFLIEQRQAGNIVIITSNITRDDNGNPISTSSPQAGRDICHHTSDTLLPTRAFWSARQFTGYNYRLSWRADINDFNHLNPQYDRLKELLAKDKYIPNYQYTLYRPDGALCSYNTTYFLCSDYLGDEVRIGVSRPQDWQLLRETEPVFLHKHY